MVITIVAEVAAVALSEVTPDGQGARLDLGRCLGNHCCTSRLLVLYHILLQFYHNVFPVSVPHIVTVIPQCMSCICTTHQNQSSVPIHCIAAWETNETKLLVLYHNYFFNVVVYL